MPDSVYQSYPNLCDCFHTDYDFDHEVGFVRDRAADIGIHRPCRILEIGCGTGENTRQIADDNAHVIALDPHRGMLQCAREKTAASFGQAALPALPITGRFPIVFTIRAVINHLSPDHVEPALQELCRCVDSPGVLVFDNFHFPRDGADVALDIGQLPTGQVARIVAMNPREDGCLDWDTVFFLPDGRTLVNRRPITPLSDEMIETVLRREGLRVQRFNGFTETDDDRTVFVGYRE